MIEPKEAIILRIAKRIFNAEHPRKEWVLAPNYTQARMQGRYTNLAHVVFHEALAAAPFLTQIPDGWKLVEQTK